MPERNKLITETYLNNVRDKKTVVFCASVHHAQEISALFKEKGINCEAVSGSVKSGERARILDLYENRDIQVLCACDLLKRGLGQSEDKSFVHGQAESGSRTSLITSWIFIGSEKRAGRWLRRNPVCIVKMDIQEKTLSEISLAIHLNGSRICDL